MSFDREQNAKIKKEIRRILYAREDEITDGFNWYWGMGGLVDDLTNFIKQTIIEHENNDEKHVI